MGKTLIAMAELLHRVAHAIFKKKPKTGGTDTDRLFDALGAIMDAVRADIVLAADMMHPATAQGAYLEMWGKNLNGLYRIPGETDAAYAARLGNAGAFWISAGATGFFATWLAQIGWSAVVTEHPTNWARRVLTLSATTGLTRPQQVVADVEAFRARHLRYVIELDGLAWAGVDYEYGQAAGWDSRPALDNIIPAGV